ncbi:MAG: hypothetical protein ACUVQX_04595 [Candidatus Bathycorpusculaceae bacterium]
MDNVDKVICISPFLGVLDIISTLNVESLGYLLSEYEVGPLARIFVSAGLTYLYISVYLLILGAFAYILWYIKIGSLTLLELLTKSFSFFLSELPVTLTLELLWHLLEISFCLIVSVAEFHGQQSSTYILKYSFHLKLLFVARCCDVGEGA